MVEEITVNEARRRLMQYGLMVQSRDDLVRTAYVSGVRKSEIAHHTGIARGTIDRILDLIPDGPASARAGGE